MALLAAQVLIRAMKGTGVRRVVSLVTLCAGCVDGCVGGFGPGVIAKAFPPARFRPGASPRSQGAAEGRTTKGRIAEGRAARGCKRAAESGRGPAPASESSRATQGRQSRTLPHMEGGWMVLKAGLFVFSFYRLLYKTQAHEKLRVSSPGALRVVLLTVPDRKELTFTRS